MKHIVFLEEENQDLRKVCYSKEDHDDLKTKYEILERQYKSLSHNTYLKTLRDDCESFKKENETLKLMNENLKATNEKLSLELKTSEDILQGHRKTFLKWRTRRQLNNGKAEQTYWRQVNQLKRVIHSLFFFRRAKLWMR